LKVLQINKTDAGGGAAIAANRLNRALRRNGVDSKLLVQDLCRSEEGVFSIGKGVVAKGVSKVNFMLERLSFLPYQKNATAKYSFSLANMGVNITNHHMVQEADIIHLHCVNNGFMSIDSFGDLLSCGKPIVWTQHNMWSFTGGCHFAGTCLEFLEFCSYCPYLRESGKKDLSARLFARKRSIYNKSNLSIVSSSRWLRTLSQESKLLRKKNFFSIPNPIDVNFYMPKSKLDSRHKLGLSQTKKMVLFGAENGNDPRKGMRYFIEALNVLGDSFPLMKENTELVVFGKMDKSLMKQLPLKINYYRHVEPKMLVDLYNAADCYVLPSLQVNLPNTIMESMACGTPVVGFSIGGVPEMITHKKSGYLAEVKNSLSLATGIYETLFVSDLDEMGKHARDKAELTYAEPVVVDQYKQLYASLLTNNKD